MKIKDLDRKSVETVPKWDSTKVADSLNALFEHFVLTPLSDSITWYFEKRKKKGRLGLWLRLSAILPAGAGVSIPIVSDLIKKADGTTFIPATWAVVALLTATGLIWMDRLFGGTSGWIRYMTVGLDIAKFRDEAVLQWGTLQRTWSQPPSSDQISTAVRLIRDKNQKGHDFVRSETDEWITEFRSSLRQFESMVQTRLRQSEEMLAKVREEEAAPKTGAVKVTIANPYAISNLEIQLEGGPDGDNEAPDPRMGKQAVFLGVVQGLWRVSATGEIDIDNNTQVASGEDLVTVTAGQAASVALTLIAK